MIVSLPKLPVWISAALLSLVALLPVAAQEVVDDGTTSDNGAVLAGSATAWDSFAEALSQGFTNILPGGPVHILFVLALLFLSRRSGPLIWQLGLFALGYISALTLGAYGIINISAQVAFPLMAAAVVILGIDNIYGRDFGTRRILLVFGLALIHGFGLANGFETSGPAILPTLVGYIIGIEMALLLVATIVAIAIWEAIRVDQGVNEVLQSYAIYGVLAAAALALIALNPPFLVDILHHPVWVFAAPQTALFALCTLSVAMRDRIDAYHYIVAVPVSAALAAAGAYLLLAPVLL